jgi:hypothetical protein
MERTSWDHTGGMLSFMLPGDESHMGWYILVSAAGIMFLHIADPSVTELVIIATPNLNTHNNLDELRQGRQS